MKKFKFTTLHLFLNHSKLNIQNKSLQVLNMYLSWIKTKISKNNANYNRIVELQLDKILFTFIK